MTKINYNVGRRRGSDEEKKKGGGTSSVPKSDPASDRSSSFCFFRMLRISYIFINKEQDKVGGNEHKRKENREKRKEKREKKKRKKEKKKKSIPFQLQLSPCPPHHPRLLLHHVPLVGRALHLLLPTL